MRLNMHKFDVAIARWAQVLRPTILKEGFEKIRKDQVEVTDDVSIAEYIGKPVSIMTLYKYFEKTFLLMRCF